MPRLARVCSEPGCSKLVPCPAHPRKTWSDAPASQRGYGSEHQRLRRILLQPGTMCRECKVRAASILDHVVPLAEGGKTGLGNVQPLCARCSHAKTRREQQRGLARAKARRLKAAAR